MVNKTSLWLAMCAFSLMGCGKEPSNMEPEVLHCASVAGLATDTYGDITVVRVRHWVLENTRSVQLNFEYPPDVEEFKTGHIVCTYDFPLSVRSDPDRTLNAKTVYFKGRHFSESELNYVNTSMFRPRPNFKVIP